MLRPSRDWRESITLSSRDPHFGQRIVSEHSVSHNNLWRQCANNNRTTPLPTKGNLVPYEDRPLACPAVIDRRCRNLNRLQAGGPSSYVPSPQFQIKTRPKSCARGTMCSYAAAALGAAIFFFGLAFFSSNSKPTFPFSNFR